MGFFDRFKTSSDQPAGSTADEQAIARYRYLLRTAPPEAIEQAHAEAFARLHGGDRVEAHSCGSRPSGQVNPRAVQFLREVGYDLTTHTSKSVEQFDGTDVDVAVTMGCGDACPLVKAGRRIDWQIPDPKHLSDEEFRSVRDEIERRVKDLLADIL